MQIVALLIFLAVVSVGTNNVFVDQGRSGNAAQHGITVSASASVTVPATSATVTVSVLSSQSSPAPQDVLTPIAGELAKAGFDKPDTAAPATIAMGIGPSMSSIAVSTQAPTVEMMKRAVAAVTTSSSGIAQFTIAQIRLSAKSCGDAVDRAREAAITKAKSKAQTVARQIGTQLGKIVGINTSEDASEPNSGCSSQFTVGGAAAFAMNQNQGLPSPDDYASVTVSSNVTVTYAIRER